MPQRSAPAERHTDSLGFIGRQNELEALDRFYDWHMPALMILYGRLRVGKTRLIAARARRLLGATKCRGAGPGDGREPI